MKRIAAGIVSTAAATAAAVLAVPIGPPGISTQSPAVAYTAGGGWVFTPADTDLADATVIQAPLRSQLEWVVPGTFSNDGESMTGELLIRPTGGALHQPDFQFVTPGYGTDGTDNPNSALYAYGSPTGSGYGVSAYYFAPNGAHDATGSAGQFNTPLGPIHLDANSSWLLHPADYTDPITYQDVLGIDGATHSGVTALPFDDALALGPGGSGDYTADYGDMTPVLYQDMPVWHFGDAQFSDDDTTLHGTVYLNSSPAALGLYNEEFVSADGAVYYYSQGAFGFDNMYYNPGGGGAVVDIMKTPLGEVNMSWLSWLFTPPDYSGATPEGAATVLGDMLGDPALSDTIDFGQATLPADEVASGAAAAIADAAGGL